MILKHDIPILEYDTDECAVLMPDHEKLGLKLPEKAVFAFLGSYIDEYAKNHNAVQVQTFVSATKNYPVYILRVNNEEICLCQAPVGAAAAVQFMDWLIAYGVRKIISAGSCGVLCDMEENRFLIPYKALRDEGTSYHYLPPYRYAMIDKRALGALEKAIESQKIEYIMVVSWTTDGFFRETRDKLAYRKEEGCQVVEMECAALAACAAFRNVIWGEILFTADTLANEHAYDERGWGRASHEAALMLCIDAVLNL